MKSKITINPKGRYATGKPFPEVEDPNDSLEIAIRKVKEAGYQVSKII